MISKEQTDRELAELIEANRAYEVNVLSGDNVSINLPLETALNVQLVEDYFHYLQMEESTQCNAWKYIANWVASHKKVYCVNTQEELLNVDVIEAPLEAFRGFSILYSNKKNALHHCEVFYGSVLKNYHESISLIQNNSNLHSNIVPAG